ncbi:MFS transporter [Providencia manganoxydans]
MIIQAAMGSINPVITLYIRDLSDSIENLAFISGVIASIPGIAALLSAPRLGKLSDRIGPEKVLLAVLGASIFVLFPMGLVSSYWELGALRFLLGALNAALLPAVQTLIIYNISHEVTGRIFSYNQALRDVGNVTGPLMGSFVAASYGFRAVFFFTAALVLFNLIYSWYMIKRQTRSSKTPSV